VKREKSNWLVDNPFRTKRFALYVGRRCLAATIQDVALELRLNWKTVKDLDIEYMRAQLRRAGAGRDLSGG
jgi:transposase